MPSTFGELTRAQLADILASKQDGESRGLLATMVARTLRVRER